MIAGAYIATPAGVLIPAGAVRRQDEAPAVPCPANVREQLKALRAEFMQRPANAGRRVREQARANGQRAAEACRALVKRK